MAKPSPRFSVVEVVHAAAFGVGLGALVIGVFSAAAIWYLIAAPCLILSGALVLFGCTLTFRGPLGAALRAALGASQLTRLRIRALLWIAAGIWIGLLGLERLRADPDDQRWLRDPLVSAPEAAERELAMSRGRGSVREPAPHAS